MRSKTSTLTFLMMVMVASSVMAQDGPSAEALKIADAMWSEVQPALTLMGATDFKAIKEDYMDSAESMIKRIDTLQAEKKQALVKAAKPITAINELQINKGLKGSQRIYAPTVTEYVPPKKSEKLTDAQIAELRKFLTGTWTRKWGSESYEWVIDADGKGVENSTRRGKAKEPENLELLFEQTGTVKVKKGNGSQTYVFLKEGKNFYTSSNLLYDFYELADKNKFRMKMGREFVIFDGKKCTVISKTGLITTASKAAWASVDGVETFQLTYQFAGEVNHFGKPIIHNKKLVKIGGHIVHSALVEAGTWVKK